MTLSPVIALVGAVFTAALATVQAKHALEHTSVDALLAVRFVVGCTALVIVATATSRSAGVPKRQLWSAPTLMWKRSALATLAPILTVAALIDGDPGQVALIVYLTPLAVLLHDSATGKIQLRGVDVALAILASVLIVSLVKPDAVAVTISSILALCAALTLTLRIIIERTLTVEYSDLDLQLHGYVVGSLVCGVAFIVLGSAPHVALSSDAVIFALFALCSNVLFTMGLRIDSKRIVSIVMLIEPLIVVVVAIAVGQSSLSVTEGISGLILFVVLTTMMLRRYATPTISTG